MRKITLAVALLALATAPMALAKGPTHAEITGPGLAHPIVYNGYGEGGIGSNGFASFVEGVGFFPAMFGQQPNPMLAGRPGGDLGPRYTIRYRVPTGDSPATIVQTLYPYAAGGAVVYTKPGQRLFGTATPGGWFRAWSSVKLLLTDHGLPATAPADTGSDGRNWLAWAVGGVLVVLTAVALGSRLRRRPQPRTA